MSLTTVIEPRDEYLAAEVSGEFTTEAGVEAFQRVLAAVVTTGLRRVVVDITRFETTTTAVNKVTWALGVDESMRKFADTYGFSPRVGIHGEPPFVEPYKPGTEYLVGRNVPVRVCDSRGEAVAFVDGAIPGE